MKISIGTALQTGPFGGGNQFARAIANHLGSRGMRVSFDLRQPDLDIILLTEPRGNRRISAYSDQAVLRYLLRTNPQALVVHRLNTSDDGEGTSGTTRRLAHANRVADYTVYVSAWLQGIFQRHGLSGPSRVIHNGSDRSLFHSRGHRLWDGTGPLRVVTHHWSNNARKGFDVYAMLDAMIATGPLRGRVHFTVVGRVPDGFRLRHATHLPPRPPSEVAEELRRHHVYLTAARDEAGAHHPNEGASCGLPLLYRESGCLPEYCGGFGVPFRAEALAAALEEMMASYDDWAARVRAYPHTSERMGNAYLALFESLLDRRRELLDTRRTTPRELMDYLPELPLQRTTAAACRWLLQTTGLRR